MDRPDRQVPLARCAHADIGGGYCDAPGCPNNFADVILAPRPPGSGPVTYHEATPPRETPHGVRARLGWYWRRVQRKPWRYRYLQPPLGIYVSVTDPRPPWRKPRPVDWAAKGWTDMGYITDAPPEAFRPRRADPSQVPADLKRPAREAGQPIDPFPPRWYP
jgi:hypothetical protein